MLLVRKAMTNLNSVLKRRDMTLLTKVQSRLWSSWWSCYGCESWSEKKAEHQRIDALELWCWRSLLRGPLDSKEIKPVNHKGNQSWILFRRAAAEAAVFWSSGANSQLIGKVSNAGKDWGQKEKRVSEDEMAGWHHWCMDMNLGKLQEMVWDREAWRGEVRGVAKSRTWLENWTTITTRDNYICKRSLHLPLYT